MKNLTIIYLFFICLTSYGYAQSPSKPAKFAPQIDPNDLRIDSIASLKFGDKAPTVKFGRVLKGKPIENLEKGNVYVLDFWGTRCGPCIKSFPHMKALEAKYPKATFVQVTITHWGKNTPYPDTDDQRVEFVKNRGDEMMKNVLEDNQDVHMVENWLKKTGTLAIPRIFIVDKKGNVIWYGKPNSDELEKTLISVL